jgi:hypothetical protein
MIMSLTPGAQEREKEGGVEDEEALRGVKADNLIAGNRQTLIEGQRSGNGFVQPDDEIEGEAEVVPSVSLLLTKHISSSCDLLEARHDR